MSQTLSTAKTQTLLIGGQKIGSDMIEEVRSPWDDAVVGSVCVAGPAEVELAIASCVGAREAARTQPRHERRRILREIAAGLRDDREAFARLIALEAGKPITQARAEVDRAILTFDLAADEATRMGGEMVPSDLDSRGEGFVTTVHRTPVGPIAAIAPFNFPLNLVAHKIAPAIAAGCSMVLKPARRTPLTALRLGQLAAACGLPDGVLNVIHCDRELGDRLVTDARLRMLTFTGSAEVGWDMKARAGKKKVVLELGGNAAVLVEPDADVAWAVERCVAGGFFYAGQSCISVQRLYVHDKVYAAFLEQLLRRVDRLHCGDPLDPNTEVGPVIDEANAARIVRWLEEAAKGGARILAGGGRKGTMVEPTIVENPPAGGALACEEIFGPVVTVERYDQLDTVLDAVNSSRYGLQAGLFTHDVRTIYRVLETLEVGGLVVNEAPTVRFDNYPYGGVKDSGLGREGVRYALEEMTETRVLVLNTRR